MTMLGPIREWAREQGIEVGERGMIPQDILNQYKQAHDIGGHEVVVPHYHPVPATVHFVDEQLEQLVEADEPMLTFTQWLQIRDELASLIGQDSHVVAAERVLAAGWQPPHDG